MTLLAEEMGPLIVDSFAIAEHIGLDTAFTAARTAARLRATGGVDSARITVPYGGCWMRIMVAALPELDVIGYKEFHISAENTVRYAVHLFEMSTGRPLGIVDSALTTTLRTAAAATVAVETYFGRGTRVRLGVIGSGDEAMAGLRALHVALTLTEVRVFSRSAVNREKFATAAAEEMGFDVQAVESARQAAQGCDLVYVATNSGGKVVAGLDTFAGVPFVASIGSTLPVQRELDDDVLAAADSVIVDTPDVLDESGDAIAAAAHGLDHCRVSLLGDMATRTWNRSGLTIYKSIGSPEQDVVLAHAIVEAAVERGFGERIRPLSVIKKNL